MDFGTCQIKNAAFVQRHHWKTLRNLRKLCFPMPSIRSSACLLTTGWWCKIKHRDISTHQASCCCLIITRTSVCVFVRHKLYTHTLKTNYMFSLFFKWIVHLNEKNVIVYSPSWQLYLLFIIIYLFMHSFLPWKNTMTSRCCLVVAKVF